MVRFAVYLWAFVHLSALSCSIGTRGLIIAGGLSPRTQRLVVEWAQAHQSELRENWLLARAHQPLISIEPLR